MTVKDFLEQNRTSTITLMTPGGFVYLTPVTSLALLEGKSIASHPGAAEAFEKVSPEEILPQKIHTANKQDGVWHILTDFASNREKEAEKEIQNINLRPSIYKV